MAEFIDILAQVRVDVDGGSELQKAQAQAEALSNQIFALRKAIIETNDKAKKNELQKALNLARLEADKLNAKMKALPKEVDKTNTAFSNLKGLAAGAFAGFSVLELGRQIIDVLAQFQKFEAVLTNLTGSNEEAKRLIATFTEFAASTPFQVEEVIDAYIKLRNTGITPTTDMIRKLGDVAAASGKGLDQVIEAFTDASTFQFERLRELGFTYATVGNKVRFTFRNVTTEVEKSTDAIQRYFIGLGELEGVQGSNAAIAKTLGGQISNLKDNFTQLLVVIGEQAAPGISKFFGLLSKGLEIVTNALKTDSQVQELLKKAGVSAKATLGDGNFLTGSTIVAERLEFFVVKMRNAKDATQELLNIIQDPKFKELPAELQAAFISKAQDDFFAQFQKIDTPPPKKGIDEAEKKAAEARKNAIKDITADLQSALADQEQKLLETQIKGKEESIETIRALSELEKQEALRAIDEREAAIREKLKGNIPANIQALLAQLRTGIDRQFALSLEQDIDAFKAKKEKEIIEFETARAAARAAARAKAAEEAAQDLENLINSLGNINKTYSLQSEIAEADALTAITNQYKEGAISKEEFEKQKTDIQRKYQSERIRLAIAEIELQIDALKQLNDPAKLGQIQELQAQIAKLRQEGAELQADPVEKNKELFNTIKAGYSEVLSIVQQVNAAIVANETEKINKLIALQQQRVDEANRIADEGNAEALEREQARLETLLVQREEAAQRQQRLSLILQASNFALAASEAILAVTKAGAFGGPAAPVTIGLVSAALAAGIGFILSLVNSTKGSVAAFKEGTPYVTGSDGIDKVPAMLTKGERVITVDDNQRYSPIYDYLSTHRPSPAAALAMLKGNAPNYAGLQTAYETNRRIEAERALSKALLEKLTFVNGNLEILVTETVKNRNTGKVKITNVNDIAKAVNSDNLRWKI